MKVLLLLALCATALAPLFADDSPDAGLMRMPAVCGKHIASAYAGDIWLAPKDGERRCGWFSRSAGIVMRVGVDETATSRE